MPKLRDVIAGLAISTAVAGGAVGLSTATTATAASAATIHSDWGDWGGWGDWANWGSCHRNRWHKFSHTRFHHRHRHHGDVNKVVIVKANARGMSDIDFD
ncbi:hypothetical protein N5079_20410 [Planotetraspora sp. A-T 1434]|uniref:hypothetical protein n=1 Tax=Planotetraspora sp. A-T 1434 TaxID=2979219 RepID=UPI0021C07CBE|nr:hypothetical protein [Planotetraspora sp. A-T 1434]MCT9932567.1 hypothetical protein [Planotetraspora sp. A-T 1434]